MGHNESARLIEQSRVSKRQILLTVDAVSPICEKSSIGERKVQFSVLVYI